MSITSSAPQSITMYGADWCGDCIRAKAFFADNDIDYDYVDLIEVPEGTDVVLERNNGVQKIPVIIFPDDSHLTEPTNDQLAAKMAELAELPDETSEAGGAQEVAETHEVVQLDNRFELRQDGEVVSFANFTESNGVVTIPHVATNPAYRGRGNAGRLMDGLLAQLRDADKTVVPLCPFAAAHISDDPQWHDLVHVS